MTLPRTLRNLHRPVRQNSWIREGTGLAWAVRCDRGHAAPATRSWVGRVRVVGAADVIDALDARQKRPFRRIPSPGQHRSGSFWSRFELCGDVFGCRPGRRWGRCASLALAGLRTPGHDERSGRCGAYAFWVTRGRFSDYSRGVREAVTDPMWSLVEDLYPICRSITGDGVRATLDRIERDLPAPLLRSEVPTGTQVLDWTVPNEWNIRDAYVARPDGTRVVDFGASNLHVVSYSAPVRERMSLAELRPHLHTLPDLPDWIPYRTSYYAETWGFCLSQRALDALPEGDYEVCHRLDARAGSPQLRRAGPAGRGPGGGPVLDARLPSVAGRRQPVVDRRRHRARPESRVAPPSLHLPIHLRAGHDRHDRLARAEPRGRAAHPGGPDADLPRRRLAVHVQADDRGHGRDRPGRGARPARRRDRPWRDRLLPVRLRRTPVQLARIPRPGGLADAGPPRPVPGVPHVGRQPRVHLRREPRGIARDRARRSSTSSRATGRTRTSRPTASRSSARAASTDRSAAPTSPTSTWRCCGS